MIARTEFSAALVRYGIPDIDVAGKAAESVVKARKLNPDLAPMAVVGMYTRFAVYHLIAEHDQAPTPVEEVPERLDLEFGSQAGGLAHLDLAAIEALILDRSELEIEMAGNHAPRVAFHSLCRDVALVVVQRIWATSDGIRLLADSPRDIVWRVMATDVPEYQGYARSEMPTGPARRRVYRIVERVLELIGLSLKDNQPFR